MVCQIDSYIEFQIFQISSDDKLLSSPTPDLYSFTISGLQGVLDKHGPGSQKVNDASGLVSKFLNTVSWRHYFVSIV